MYRTQVLCRGTHLKTRRINTELPIRIHYRINLDAHKSRLPLARIEIFPDLGKSIVTCFGITFVADALAQSIWNKSTDDLDERRMRNMAVAAIPLGIWYSAWFSFLDFHLKKAPFISALIDTLFLPAVHAFFLIPFHIIHNNKVHFYCHIFELNVYRYLITTYLIRNLSPKSALFGFWTG